MRRLLAAALLLALLAVLVTGQRSGRLRSRRLNRKALLVADQVKRNQLKLRRRGGAINNEVAPIGKASSRAKGRLRKKGYRANKKETSKQQGRASGSRRADRPGGSRRADRPGRAQRRRNGAKRKNMADPKGRRGGSRRADRPGRAQRRRNGANRKMADPKDVCLLKALQKCGKRITSVRPTSKFGKRCQAKEKFLDCMSRSQRRGCKVRKRRRRRRAILRLIKKRQEDLQKLLINSRGCVIGVDLSAATPLTNR